MGRIVSMLQRMHRVRRVRRVGWWSGWLLRRLKVGHMGCDDLRFPFLREREGGNSWVNKGLEMHANDILTL